MRMDRVKDETLSRLYLAAGQGNLWSDGLAELRSAIGLERIRVLRTDAVDGEDPVLASCGVLASEGLADSLHELDLPTQPLRVEVALGADVDPGSTLPWLSHHLGQACALQQQLERLGLVQEILGRLRHGVMVLGGQGERRIYCNTAMRAFLEREDGLLWSPHGLGVAREEEDRRLKRIIRDVLRGRQRNAVLRIGSASRSRSYLVSVSPLRRQARDERSPAPCALVMAAHPDAAVGEELDLAGQAFDLTAAELRLVRAMLEGNSVRGSAERLSISEHTARWHLKRIFVKVGVSTQADLVRVMLSIPPVSLSGQSGPEPDAAARRLPGCA